MPQFLSIRKRCRLRMLHTLSKIDTRRVSTPRALYLGRQAVDRLACSLNSCDKFIVLMEKVPEATFIVLRLIHAGLLLFVSFKVRRNEDAKTQPD